MSRRHLNEGNGSISADDSAGHRPPRDHSPRLLAAVYNGLHGTASVNNHCDVCQICTHDSNLFRMLRNIRLVAVLNSQLRMSTVDERHLALLTPNWQRANGGTQKNRAKVLETQCVQNSESIATTAV